MAKNFCVIVGRFQIPHMGHIDMIRYGLDNYNKVILIIGSANNARTMKNPFTVRERERMIRGYFGNWQNDQIFYREQEDHIYNYNKWFAQIYSTVDSIIGWHGDTNSNVTFLGHYKDGSSNYLKEFQNHGKNVSFYTSDHKHNSTDYRNAYFNPNLPSHRFNYQSVYGARAFLQEFHGTAMYNDIIADNNAVLKIKKAWEGSPYPPMFVTTDACVVWRNKILLIKRGDYPGKGLLALPGGYLEQDETIATGTARELLEETQLDLMQWGVTPYDTGNFVRNQILTMSNGYASAIKDNTRETHVFDDPGRSPRGRIVTHTSLIDISSMRQMPEVKANSDAAVAKFYDISSLRRSLFFEDHYDMIRYMLARY